MQSPERKKLSEFVSKKISVDDFSALRVIGKGSYGKVLLVEKIDDKKVYAMKILKKKAMIKRNQVNHIKTERRIMEFIDFPFIVKLRYAFQTSQKLYLIMDYLSGGDLRFHLSHRKSSLFTEAQTKFFLSNIIISLEYIHSKKIIHRDVKPENLLLDINGYLRLTDFGIAVYSNKENSQESNGTEGYVAPEVLMQQGYNFSSDYFALGL